MTRASSHSDAAAAALARPSGNMGLLALGVGPGDDPVPSVFHRGHVWFLEDHCLKAAPVDWLPQSLGGMSATPSWYAPNWAAAVTAATITGAGRDADPLHVHVPGEAPWRPQELTGVLAGLGIESYQVQTEAPQCTRMVHATVCAQMDSTGRVLGWQVAEPGSEPTDSCQQVWNVATQEWEGLEQAGDWRALALLDDMLDLAPVDPPPPRDADRRGVEDDPLRASAGERTLQAEGRTL